MQADRVAGRRQFHGRISPSRFCGAPVIGPRTSATGLRIDIVELGGADECVHRCRPLAAAVGAAEQPRLSARALPRSALYTGKGRSKRFVAYVVNAFPICGPTGTIRLFRNIRAEVPFIPSRNLRPEISGPQYIRARNPRINAREWNCMSPARQYKSPGVLARVDLRRLHARITGVPCRMAVSPGSATGFRVLRQDSGRSESAGSAECPRRSGAPWRRGNTG